MRDTIRLIVTDMDGTLLDAAHQLPPGFPEIVMGLRQRGVRWAIASGRQLANLKKRFDALSVPVEIIAENGALALCAGEDEPFFCDLTPVTRFTDILTAALAVPGATPVLCGATCAWVHNAYPENFTEVARYFEKTEQWQTLAEVAHLDLCKIAVYHPDAAGTLHPALAPFECPDVRVILSGPNWVDVQSATIDKRHALEAVMQRFGYTPQNVMVFGDYLNDAGMLQGGVHGVAMGNALPEILALTPYHARPNTQNGVINYLQTMGLLP
ncbi:MAG: HAD family phosphatase [Kiritimatiellae bacterium]|nr:HAD family phosphatase [Kiritimatiellia bacterium]